MGSMIALLLFFCFFFAAAAKDLTCCPKERKGDKKRAFLSKRKVLQFLNYNSPKKYVIVPRKCCKSFAHSSHSITFRLTIFFSCYQGSFELSLQYMYPYLKSIKIVNTLLCSIQLNTSFCAQYTSSLSHRMTLFHTMSMISA